MWMHQLASCHIDERYDVEGDELTGVTVGMRKTGVS